MDTEIKPDQEEEFEKAKAGSNPTNRPTININFKDLIGNKGNLLPKKIPTHLENLFGNIHPDEIKEYCNETTFAVALNRLENLKNENTNKEIIINRKNEIIDELKKDIYSLEGKVSIKEIYMPKMKYIAFIGGIIVTFSFKLLNTEKGFSENILFIILFLIGIIISTISLLDPKKSKIIFNKLTNKEE